MFLAKAVRLVCRACIIPAVAACGDVMGPRLADPTSITAQLDAMSSVLRTRVFESSARLSYSFRAAVTGSPSSGIFPAEALGTTYEWNLGASRYDTSAQAGAPADGVRFLLYALDTVAVAPVDPLALIGQVDLIDVTVGTPTLRLVVASGTTARADYTVSGSASTWAAAGDISVGADTLAFDGTLSSGVLSSSIDVGFRKKGQDLDSRLRYDYSLGFGSSSFAVDFRLQLGADVVHVTGSAFFSCPYYGDCGGGGRLTVTVNGRGFATVDIDADGREIYRGQWTPDERLALDAILRAISWLRTGFGRLVDPATQFLGACQPLCGAEAQRVPARKFAALLQRDRDQSFRTHSSRGSGSGTTMTG